MGPWSHGDWAKSANATIGNINFGDSISGFYQKKLKLIFHFHFEKITVRARKQIPEPCFLTLELEMENLMASENTENNFLSAKEISYRQGQRICIEEFVSDPKASSVYRRYQPAWNHASKYMTDDFLHVVQMYLF
jgi:hypothetical protein